MCVYVCFDWCVSSFNLTSQLPEEMLEAHLDYEWSKNQDKYGMRVLNDPVQEDSIWMNGPPTISYIQLQMGKKSFEEAIEPFFRMSENFRSR
eukprot:SAG11_NODE_6880_length_1232_cov_1.195057_3_plen_92_part_00